LSFGGDYDASAHVFQILIWAAPLFLVENYAITLLMVERHMRASLWVLVLHLAATVLLLPPLAQMSGAIGAAWAVVLAGGLGTLYGIWILRRLGLPLQVKRFWGMAASALLAGAVAVFLPAPWFVQAVASSVFYLVLCWVTGVLAMSDFSTLRNTLWVKK
jgi:O-antigen/teichoic acid export membrane protein